MLKEIEFDNLASIGGIQDQPGYQLPPEAWTLTNNMREYAEGVETMGGWTSTFTNGMPNDTPMFLMYVASAVQPWWLWASGAHIYVWDTSTHTDITRASGGNYGATDPKNWNGTIIGGIPILNNGVDAPQYWASYSTLTKMQPVTAWPASTTAKVVRAFLNYLIALNVTVSGTNLPHRVRWSNEAAPGSLPGTWDFTDATKNAGQVDIPDVDSGQILDGLPLRGQFFVYKENSVWRFQFVGGTFIFDDQSFLDTAGILATRCLTLTPDGVRHVWLSQDDLMWHNGLQAESILTKKMRRYLFNQIDPSHFDESFLFTNALYNEIWVCYPSNGSSSANRALVWNYKSNALWEADISFQAATTGNLNQSGSTTWANANTSWQNDVNPWLFSLRRKVLAVDGPNKLFYILDNGTTRNGTAFTGTLQRTGLSIVGKKRTGEPIEDFEHNKLISKVWPKVTSGPVQVRVGYQKLVNGPVAWTPYQAFDPNSQLFVDGMLGSGKAVAIEFSSTNPFRIDGYKLDMAVTGKFP